MSTPQKFFAGIGFGIVTLAAIVGWLSGIITLGTTYTSNEEDLVFIGFLGIVGVIIALSTGRSQKLNEGWRQAFTLGATLTVGIGGSILLLTLATPFTAALLMTLVMPILYGLFAAAAKPNRNRS